MPLPQLKLCRIVLYYIVFFALACVHACVHILFYVQDGNVLVKIKGSDHSRSPSRGHVKSTRFMTSGVTCPQQKPSPVFPRINTQLLSQTSFNIYMSIPFTKMTVLPALFMLYLACGGVGAVLLPSLTPTFTASNATLMLDQDVSFFPITVKDPTALDDGKMSWLS